MIKAVVVAREKEVAQKLAEALNAECDDSVRFEPISMVTDMNRAIRSDGVDLLLTIDLAGFEGQTLTDNISYNLLDCKQIHFMTKTNLPNEKYLKNFLSIAMFFVCVGEADEMYFRSNYPNIPWLRRLFLDDGNKERGINNLCCANETAFIASALAEIIQQVFEEAGMICGE